MKTKIKISEGSPLSAEDCRMEDWLSERHIIVRFRGREYATKLADWLDESYGLNGTVVCIEYNTREGESAIDLVVPDDREVHEMRSLIRDKVRLFCQRYEIEAEVEIV